MASSNERQIFYVELKPGETTIVSWKKLLKEEEEKKKMRLCTAGTCQKEIHSVGETPESVTDGNSGAVKPKDKCKFFVKSEKPESILTCQKARKRRIDVSQNDKKTDGPLSTKHVKLENVRASTIVDNGLENIANSRTSDATSYDPASAQALPSVDGYPKRSANPNRRLLKFSSSKNDFCFQFGTKDSLKKKKKKTTKTTESEVLKDSGVSINLPNLCGGDVASHFSSESGKLICKAKRLVVTFSSLRKKENDSENIDFSLPRCSSPSQSVLDVDLGKFRMACLIRLSHDPQLPARKSPWIRTASASKEASAVKPNRTKLEKAVKELEKIVAESRCSKIETLDANASSLAIGRRMPADVKQKLAEVANIVWSSNGISLEELVTRLVSILGRLVEGPTMKKKLQELILLKLTSKQDQVARSHHNKNELLRLERKKVRGRVTARPMVEPTAAKNAESTAQVTKQAIDPLPASPTIEIKNAQLAVPTRVGLNSDGDNLDFPRLESNGKRGRRPFPKEERLCNPNGKAPGNKYLRKRGHKSSLSSPN